MTPEEHFEKASEHLVEANSTNNTARFWAQMRVSEHHTALGRAKSEHEARKDFAAERARATIPPYTPIPAARARDLMAQMQPGGGAAEEKPYRNALAEAGKAYNRQANRTAAHDDDINKLNAVINARVAELGTLKRQLEQKERDLADLQAGYDGVAKSWTERGDLILKLEQQVRELRVKLGAYATNELVLETRERQVAEQESQIEGLRAQVKELGDKLWNGGEYRTQCEQLVKENDRLAAEIKSWQEISDNNARALFAANEAAGHSEAPTLGPETVTVDFGGNGIGSKSRRIYGALRPAEQVWRTPKATKWGGLRGRWAVDADVVSDVAEVFVRSVDYPDTDEVGVDLVTWPKDLEPSRRSHDTLEILNRQRMSRKAWATHPDNIGDMEHP